MSKAPAGAGGGLDETEAPLGAERSDRQCECLGGRLTGCGRVDAREDREGLVQIKAEISNWGKWDKCQCVDGDRAPESRVGLREDAELPFRKRTKRCVTVIEVTTAEECGLGTGSSKALVTLWTAGRALRDVALLFREPQRQNV